MKIYRARIQVSDKKRGVGIRKGNMCMFVMKPKLNWFRFQYVHVEQAGAADFVCSRLLQYVLCH